MTLAQAIATARYIKVHATDVIELEINKKQAHYLRKTHGPWMNMDHWEDDEYELASHWSLQGDVLFLSIPA